MEEIYFDNAATTPVSAKVFAELQFQYKNNYGNASTLYQPGRKAREVVEVSREVIADSINANTNDIIFTSGGSESDNMAITQTALSRSNLGKHIITTVIEHEAVLRPLKALEEMGFRVTYLPVDANGVISLNDFKAALDADTILVSIMSGNNEVGSMMPIHEIGNLIKDHQALFHTDAVQTYGLTDIDVQRDHIDLLSTSAHKINGPKGIGFLYKRNGVNLPSLIKGGDQEMKRRAGTENVPAIAGFAVAVKQLTKEEKQRRQQLYLKYKEYIIQGLRQHNVPVEVNGAADSHTLGHVLNIWIKGISTYIMQTRLDMSGIYVSGGSACTAGSIEPSHVLTAMYGKDSPRISESIRISFGRYNNFDQLDKLILAIAKIVNNDQ